MSDFPGKRGPKSPKKGVVVASSGALEAPSFLTDAARAEWKRQEGRFEELGLRDVDLALVVAYCEMYAMLAESLSLIEEKGRFGVDRFGRSYQHPWVTVAQKASCELRQLSERIGLSPGARAKLPAVADAAVSDPGLEQKRAALFGGRLPKR
jgi:P27 family predicted phage terminase small subunit